MKINRDTLKMCGILFGIAAIFTGAVLVPFGIRDSRLQARIDTAREELGITQVDHSGLTRLNKQVEDLRAQVAGRGQSIPDEEQISLVLKDLSKLINAPGVSSQEIVTENARFFADYNILPVNIQFNAPFVTAFDLVTRLESLSRVVRVDRLEFEADQGYPRQPLIVSLELSAFFASQTNGGEQ